MVEQGELLEWAVVHGERYGTPRAWVDEHLARGHDVILEIDVQGALQIRAARPDALLIFLAPQTLEELERRLARRGTEDPAGRELRLRNAQQELAAAERFDRVVVNDDVQRCVAEVHDAIVDARRS